MLLKQAVDLLINRAGNDEELTRLFVSFIKTKTEDDKSWLIENDFYVIAEELLKEGIYVIGFFYPVVPKGQARIRVQLSAAHERMHLDRAIDSFVRVGQKLELI